MSTKILYIEDNYYNIVLVKKILESNGFEFYEARNGLEGVEKAKEIKPDLILMDINLPELSGFEVTTKIKSIKYLKNVKIIAVTADVNSETREKAIAAGCDGYIPKPIDNNFVNKVKEFLAGKKEKLSSENYEIKVLKKYSEDLVNKLEKKVRELTKANSELESAYKSIQAVNKRLLLLNKMEENFVSISSHELRTPLVVIKGFIDLALDNSFGELNPKLRNALSMCQKNIDKLMHIVDDITDFAKLRDSNINVVVSEVDIFNFIEELIKEYVPIFESRNLNYQIEIECSSKKAYFDKNFLFQAMQNLITNAIKYTPDGGSITVGAKENSDEIIFFVKDTGIGIEEEYLEKIFNKFFVISDSSHYFSGEYEFLAGGKGLGLSIVKNIAKIHNGKAWAESKGRNKGSIFYISVNKNFKTNIEKKMTLSEDKKYILSIDFPECSEYLKSDMYEVVNVDYNRFVDNIDSFRIPQILFLDISDKNFDNVVIFLKSLKESEKFMSVPIVVIDKDSNIVNKSNLFSIGIEEYISRPIQSEVLHEIVKSFL